MKKSVFIFLILVVGIFLSKNIKASHFAGGDLSYICIGGNNYKVSLSFYRDCSGIPAPTSVSIAFSCSSNSNFNFTTNLNKVVGTGQEITCPCLSNPTSCSNGNGYGVREYVYQGVVILPPCNIWTMSYSGGARNPITTIAGSGNWYIPATLNNLQAPANSAPLYNNKMIPLVTMGKLSHLDYGAIDPDGDSLSYSLYAPFISSTSSITYNFPYTATNFFPSSTPITIDPTTGIISSTPTQILSSVIGVKITQWRNINGVMTNIGTNYRDLTIKSYLSSNNAPSLSGMVFSNNLSYSTSDTVFHLDVGYGIPINFNIIGNDIDTAVGDKDFSISWSNSVSGALFTAINNYTDHAYGHFSWIPNAAQVSNTPYEFVATIQDTACPYNGRRSYKYYINVHNAPPVFLSTLDTVLCTGDTLTVFAQTSSQNPIYQWRWNGTLIPNPSNLDYFFINTSNLLPGNNELSVTIPGQGANAFPSQNSSTIIHIFKPNIHNQFNDSAFCINDSLVLDAGPGGYYRWRNGLGNVIDTNRHITLFDSDTYTIYVNGSYNSRCFDSDTFSLSSDPPPPQINLGNDTIITNHQSIQLNTIPGYTYKWTTGDTSESIVVNGGDLGIGNQTIGVWVYNVGCYIYDEININIILGVDNLLKPKILNAYPNPNNGVFNLEIPSNFIQHNSLNIELFSTTGKVVLKKRFNLINDSKIKLNLKDIQKGIYYLKVYNETENSVIKLIIN